MATTLSPIRHLIFDGVSIKDATEEEIQNWDDLEDTKIPTTCPLCQDEEICSHNGAPLIDGLVCEDCHVYVLASRRFPTFKGNVEEIKKNMPTIIKGQSDVHNGRADCVPLKISPRLTDLPEKRFLQYACAIECYFRAMNEYQKHQALALDGPKYSQGLIGTACSVLSSAIKYSDQLGYYTFSLQRDGSVCSANECQFPNGDRFAFIYKMRVVRDMETSPSVFAVTDAGIIPRDDPLNPHIFRLNLNGRVCGAVFNPSGVFMPMVDDFIEGRLAEQRKAEKLKQKEKERKERERKEKKEREREEMRQFAIQQKEKEEALRLARASLVVAVAKVDEELETIRKLRELNREVALKNQKLADRKEAERIAKEAEKRHAEKLKQKELERQKFISKKH